MLSLIVGKSVIVSCEMPFTIIIIIMTMSLACGMQQSCRMQSCVQALPRNTILQAAMKGEVILYSS